MKRIRMPMIGAVSLISLVAAASLQQGVILRRDLKAEQTDVYKVETKMKQSVESPMGAQDMDMTQSMTYTMKTGTAGADGKAPITLTVTDMKFDMGGAGGGMMPEMPKEMKMSGKIDERNRFTDLKVEGANAMMQMMGGSTTNSLGSSFIEFPEKEVKIGDEWDIVMPANKMAGIQESKMKAKLIGEKDGNWEVKMAGPMSMKMDIGAMMKEQGGSDPTGGMMDGAVMTGKIDMDATAIVEKGTGRTKDITMKMKTKMNMDMAGMSIGITGDGATTMKLQKK